MMEKDRNSRLYELARRISLRSFDRVAVGILSILLVIVLGACKEGGSSQTGNTDPNTITDSSGDFSITLHVDGPRQVTITWDNPTAKNYLFYKLLDYYSVVYKSGVAVVPSTYGFSYTFNYLWPQTTYCYRTEVIALYQVLWTYQWIGWSSAEVCATTPPDTTAPAVTSTQPAYGETAVMVNTAITVTFSEDIDPLTVDSSTFFVTGPSGTVSGSISIGAWAATFRPDVNLAYLSDYQVTVTTGIKDRWGHALSAPYTWSFTTGVTPDNNPPTVPAGLAAIVDADGLVALSWNPASDDVGVTGYYVYRDGSFLRHEVGTTASDAGLYVNAHYCYAVSAHDSAGNESAKSDSVCIVADLSPGTLAAWGLNWSGELGDGTTVDRSRPSRVLNVSSVSSMAAGFDFSTCLRDDGTVWAWGLNNFGQLGDGTLTRRLTPVQVADLNGITAISSGAYHSLALRSDGTVWGWGNNGNGQLGDGTTDVRNRPVQVINLHNVTAIAAGNASSLALTSDGTVWAWGYNYFGQLGNGTTIQSTAPVQVSTLINVIAIAAGGLHSLALRSDGTVWAWGGNGGGQLGDHTTIDRYTPVQVANLINAIAIAAGDSHSLALISDNTAVAWGWNASGELGNGTTIPSTSPVQVSNLSNVIAIAAGGVHSLALRSDGTVWAWGCNTYGELGVGMMSPWGTTAPVQTQGLSNIIAIGAGHHHSMALR